MLPRTSRPASAVFFAKDDVKLSDLLEVGLEQEHLVKALDATVGQVHGPGERVAITDDPLRVEVSALEEDQRARCTVLGVTERIQHLTVAGLRSRRDHNLRSAAE